MAPPPSVPLHRRALVRNPLAVSVHLASRTQHNERQETCRMDSFHMVVPEPRPLLPARHRIESRNVPPVRRLGSIDFNSGGWPDAPHCSRRRLRLRPQLADRNNPVFHTGPLPQRHRPLVEHHGRRLGRFDDRRPAESGFAVETTKQRMNTDGVLDCVVHPEGESVSIRG